MAPVEGESAPEIWSNAQSFFAQMMKIPTAELREEDVVDIRRVLAPRERKTKHEVCVVFADSETRDRVASYARNLGAYIENGKPTATFRHEVPTHLGGVYKTLLQYGYMMSGRYGRGFKRNIRYDDIALSFCIDVLLPGTTNWVTVSYERALQDRRANQKAINMNQGESLSSRAAEAGGPEVVVEDDEGAPTTSSASGNGETECNKKKDKTWGMYR